jgi:hypothetical protein
MLAKACMGGSKKTRRSTGLGLGLRQSTSRRMFVSSYTEKYGERFKANGSYFNPHFVIFTSDGDSCIYFGYDRLEGSYGWAQWNPVSA